MLSSSTPRICGWEGCPHLPNLSNASRHSLLEGTSPGVLLAARTYRTRLSDSVLESIHGGNPSENHLQLVDFAHHLCYFAARIGPSPSYVCLSRLALPRSDLQARCFFLHFCYAMSLFRAATIQSSHMSLSEKLSKNCVFNKQDAAHEPECSHVC